MRRLALLLLLLCPLAAAASPVSPDEAAMVARAWMARQEGVDRGVRDVSVFSHEGRTALYAVSLSPEGVVFVSADDLALPVVYYARAGAWNAGAAPDALLALLAQVAADIDAARAAGLSADDRTRASWAALRDAASAPGLLRRVPPAVTPLVSTTWNQNWPYNSLCPTVSSGGSGGRVYAGCVATAMAQILKYTDAPATGESTHGYTHPTYGYQYADFASTSYAWSGMPAALTASSSAAQIQAIATITYHCGVAVNMDYGPSGSGASMYNARNALVNHFRCASSAALVARGNYSASAWTALMKAELDNARPVLYCGYNQSSSGHAFVVDGYNSADYFHMNFGWGGYLDGYFALNGITPGTNNFNYNQSAIVGIEPLVAAPPILASPATNATGVCTGATLTWNTAAGATEYRVQVATDASFTSLVTDQTVYTTSLALSGLSANTQYRWRVNATGTAGTSAWSPAWIFTTLNAVVSASGPTTFCAGGSVLLSTPGGAGRSYQWLRDGAPLPQATGATHTATVSGDYVVTVTVSGCPTASAPLAVIVVPQPDAAITAAGPTTFCEGGSVVLSVPAANGTSYEWMRDGVAIGGQSFSTFAATESGSYRVRVSAAGCESLSAAVPVVVHIADPTLLVWTGAVSALWDAAGNWDNPCAVPTLGDDVVIPDSCTPPSSIPAVQLRNLTMRNIRGTQLAGPVIVTGTLAFTKGNMWLGSHDLTLAAGAQLSGGSAASHAITNGTGSFRRANLGTGGVLAPALFPVAADSAGWNPASVRNTAAAGTFAVRVLSQLLSSGLTGSPVTSGSVGRGWLLCGPADAKADLAFSWSASDELSGFVRAGSAAARSDGGTWTFLQSGASPSGTSLFTRTAVDIGSFDPLGQVFIVGNAGAVYPVDLLSFGATVTDGDVVLSWKTASERANVGFTVERSADPPSKWEARSFVPACGATSCAYEYSDARVSGTVWYRLRQVDADGSVHISHAVRAALPEAGTALRLRALYPAPLQSGAEAVTLEFDAAEGTVQVAICDVLGRRIRTLAESDGPAGIRTLHLLTGVAVPGTYILTLTQRGAVTQRLLPVLRP